MFHAHTLNSNDKQTDLFSIKYFNTHIYIYIAISNLETFCVRCGLNDACLKTT